MALLLYNFKYKYKNYIRLRSNELSMKQNYRTNLTGNAVAHFDLSSSTHTHTHRPRSPYRSYRRQPSFSLQQQRAVACAQQLSLFLGCAHSTHTTAEHQHHHHCQYHHQLHLLRATARRSHPSAENRIRKRPARV